MKRTTLWVSTLTLLAVSMAGCAGDFTGTVAGKGSAVFCVQDDPTVNFNGVFVNFGNIQINQNTSGNNTINDNDSADETMATSETMSTTDTMATSGTDNNTTTTSTATTTEATTDATTQTVSTTQTGAQEAPSSVETISVDDIDCGRVEAEGTFEGVFRGQAGGTGGDDTDNDKAEECAPENPGCIADERRGRSDSPCDRDQGFGNDGTCETIDVETGDVDVLQFKDRDAAFLAQADLEPGTIEGVCVTVEDVRVITNDGQEVNVDIQGGDLCLDGPVMIEEGKHTLVVFKVDVEKSFAQSSGDQIVFSPVIRVQAAAPVTTTITVEETVTQTATMTGNETASPTETTDTANTTATATATATETTAATSTTSTTSYSPAPTTTGP